MCREIITKTTEAILLPPIQHLSSNLYAAVFELMKLLPAKHIFDQAEKEGVLSKGAKVIESSSGVFGLALAILCAERKYKLTLVSDPVIDKPLKYRLQDLGADVIIVERREEKGGYQQSRLNKVYEYLEQNPDAFWPRQYDNKHNPDGYAPLAELLAKTLGKIDFLVASVGSGGSSVGTSKYLRAVFPDLRTIAVDSINSVIFGRPDRKRYLRGLGNSLMPKNADHQIYDEVHWVTAAEAFLATRLLHRRHQLYMGPTSGAVYMVADWLAKKYRDAKIVGIFADTGHRYELTVYSDDWLAENGLYLETLPSEPKEVISPSDAGPEWSRIAWNRRDYVDVMKRPFELK